MDFFGSIYVNRTFKHHANWHLRFRHRFLFHAHYPHSTLQSACAGSQCEVTIYVFSTLRASGCYVKLWKTMYVSIKRRQCRLFFLQGINRFLKLFFEFIFENPRYSLLDPRVSKLERQDVGDAGIEFRGLGRDCQLTSTFERYCKYLDLSLHGSLSIVELLMQKPN